MQANATQQQGSVSHTPEELRLKNSAARLSVIAAAFLILLKTATGFYTGSISVWASLLDSAMDIFASTINFFAVRAASRPPDDDHHYGHGKAESLAGLFQSLVITLSGFFLVYEAAKRLLSPRPTGHEWMGVATMLVAATVSIMLVRKLRSVARSTDSPASGRAVHYASDVYPPRAALAACCRALPAAPADPLASIASSHRSSGRCGGGARFDWC